MHILSLGSFTVSFYQKKSTTPLFGLWIQLQQSLTGRWYLRRLRIRSMGTKLYTWTWTYTETVNFLLPDFPSLTFCCFRRLRVYQFQKNKSSLFLLNFFYEAQYSTVRSRKNFVDSVPPINSEGVPSPTLPPQTLCVRLAHNWPWLTHPQWEHLFGVIA